MYAKKTVSMKLVVLLLAIVLLIGCVAGGTFAWLIAESGPVNNTFVAGQIGELHIVENDNTSKTADGKYLIVPDVDIKKDPTVTFTGNTVKAYVFVEVIPGEWQNDSQNYYLGSNREMQWTIGSDWTPLNGVPHVYYKEVNADTDTTQLGANESYPIILNNTITVSEEITELNISNFEKPLTFQAYAIQQEGHADVNAAWTALGIA